MNELMCCIIAIGIIGLILYVWIASLAVIKNKRNPKPRLNNGGPRFKDIKKVLTQSIMKPDVR